VSPDCELSYTQETTNADDDVKPAHSFKYKLMVLMHITLSLSLPIPFPILIPIPYRGH